LQLEGLITRTSDRLRRMLGNGVFCKIKAFGL